MAALDGIRGWASLAVLLFHMLPEINHGVLPELGQGWVYACFDGPLAVYVFFILSGEALSVQYLRTQDLQLVRVLAARRYLRLSLPILMASLLVYAAMAAGLAMQGRAALVLRSEWLAEFLNFRASLAGVLNYALRDVYFSPAPAQHYVPLLWTMPIEMIGSFIVFGLLALVHATTGRQRASFYGMVLLGLLVFQPILLGFLLGVLLSELRLRGGWAWLRARPGLWWGFSVGALGVTLLLSGARAMAHHDVTARFYLRAYLGHGGDAPGLANPLMMYVNALALLCVIFASPRLERFFCGRVSGFLGRISFPLYLVQFAVLITLTSGLVVRLVDPAAPDRATLYCIAGVSILASIVVAWLFAIVERRLLRLANGPAASAVA